MKLTFLLKLDFDSDSFAEIYLSHFHLIIKKKMKKSKQPKVATLAWDYSKAKKSLYIFYVFFGSE